MEREKAEKITEIVNSINEISEVIFQQKDKHFQLTGGMMIAPKSTIHEATLCAMESEKEELERKLEAIR